MKHFRSGCCCEAAATVGGLSIDLHSDACRGMAVERRTCAGELQQHFRFGYFRLRTRRCFCCVLRPNPRLLCPYRSPAAESVLQVSAQLQLDHHDAEELLRREDPVTAHSTSLRMGLVIGLVELLQKVYCSLPFRDFQTQLVGCMAVAGE